MKDKTVYSSTVMMWCQQTLPVTVQGACKEDLETPTIDIPLKFRQCVITLGGEAKGFLAALGAEVVLSDIVFSRRPSGASEPTITATDSSLFMERVAIIVDKDSDGTAQALRLRSSRALLSGAHLLVHVPQAASMSITIKLHHPAHC